MYTRVLVGYLDGERGRDALALGQVLALANDAELTIATAEDGETLSQIVREHDADLLVLGASHRGPLGRVIPGASVDRLLAEAPCAVAVAPPGFGRPRDGDLGWRPLSGDHEDAGLRVIGVGFDGTPAAAEGLKAAVHIALQNGAALRVYTVAHSPARVTGADALAAGAGAPSEVEVLRALLDAAVSRLPSEVRALPVLLRGFVAEELLKAVETGVDLLVLGSRPGGPLRRLAHRSVTDSVMQRAACPVLISPAGVRARQPALA